MNSQDVVSFVNEHYGLGATEARVLRDGSDNIIWRAETKNGQPYIVRVSKREMVNEVAFEAEWLEFLKKAAVPVAPIVNTKEGKPYATSPTRTAIMLFRFVQGKHLALANLPTPAIRSAASALAKLHNVSRGHVISLPRRRTVFSEMERAIEHAEMLKRQTPGRNRFITEVKEFLSWGKKCSFAPVLVHNDYRIDNLMFDDENKIVAILDFDWCCMGPAIKDVAHSLAEWSFPDGAREHSEDIFASFLNAYNENAKEPVTCDNNLYCWIALSCLSDASTYLIDRLEKGEIKSIGGSYMYQKFRYFSSRIQ